MPKRRVPKYSLHKATGQARVRIDGKDHYLGFYDSDESKQRYRELVAQWQARNATVAFPDMTVGQLALAYMGHATSYYVKNDQPTSEVNCVRNAVKAMTVMFKGIQVRDFSPQKLRAVRASILKTCARTTANSQTGRIVRMFRWAVGQEMVSPVVVTGLEAVEPLKKGRSDARETDPVTPVSESIVTSTLPHLPAAARAAVLMQLATGARPGEILIMRLCDVRMVGEVWEYRPNSHKTEHHGRSRVIPIGPKGQAIIKERMTTDLAAYLFPRPSGVGLAYSTTAFRKAIQRACEVAFDMPMHLRRTKRQDREEASLWRAENVWHPSQLRHTFGTLARREGGIEVARTILGHANTATTEIYAEKDLETAKALIARIG